MARWYVERVKIIKAGLDLRSLFDRITHRDKDVFDLLADERDRVQVALVKASARQSYIDPLAFQSAGFGFRGKPLVYASDLGLYFRGKLVDPAPELCALT